MCFSSEPSSESCVIYSRYTTSKCFEKLFCVSVDLPTEVHKYIYIYLFFVYMQAAWSMEHYWQVEIGNQVSNKLQQENGKRNKARSSSCKWGDGFKSAVQNHEQL